MNDTAMGAGLRGKVRINNAGCLDQCEHGPTVVVYPEQVWYGFVSAADVNDIVQSHLVEGRPVARLMLDEGCLNNPECAHKQPVRPPAPKQMEEVNVTEVVGAERG